MKRFWKIFGITFGSLLGLIVIAALVAIYIIFTPQRISPIVRNIANDYITAEHEIGDVELTFFSTFPNAGAKINGLTVINPIDGADNDTVLYSPAVIAKLDLMQLLKGSLIIDGLEIKDAFLNAYINRNGQANFDVLNLPNDTTDIDTTTFTLPFNQISLSDICLSISQASFKSDNDSIAVVTHEGRINISDAQTQQNTGTANINIRLTDNTIEILTAEPKILKSNLLSLSSPIEFDFDAMHFNLAKARLQYQQFLIDLQADVTLHNNDDISLDAIIDCNELDIKQIITIAQQFTDANIEQYGADGQIGLHAVVKGIYNISTMPLIDADIQLSDAAINYAELPYPVENISADLNAHLNLNDTTKSKAQIKRLLAQMNDTKVNVTGSIEHLLTDNMTLDADADINLNMLDIKSFLPENMTLKGNADGTINIKGKVADIADLKLERTSICGKVNITKLDFAYDSLTAQSSKATIDIQIPNNKPTKSTVRFLRGNIKLQDADMTQNNALNATVGITNIVIETSNILSKDPIVKANIRLNTDHLYAHTDSIDVQTSMADIKAYALYNTKDTTAIPQVDAQFDIEDIIAKIDTIDATLIQPNGTASLKSTANNKSEPSINAKLTLGSIDAKIGQLAHIKTDNVHLTANANRNSQKENLLLQWNPELSIQLANGDIDYQGLSKKIKIPNIDFDYSNQDFNITEGSVIVGKSDFTLSGEIRNIGKWLDNSGDLRGELTLFSDYTDVPEIMAMTSGIGSDQETKEVAETTNDDPYMVPKGMHLSLNTHINKALLPFVNETAYDLGGGLYLRDGVLIIEEMGFICNAAKLQLTAMYETPRRNNLFVGLDYHMIDIDLERLVDMIPQVDTVLPMLRSFRGNAEFHLAAETYLNSKYEVKWSTTRGACSIAGHDLTLIDGQTFTTVAKLLNFRNKKAENQVDSISAEITLFRKEIDVYPFLISMDKYKAAVGGRHNLDMTCDYHISLLSPAYLGVEISGPMNDIANSPLKHVKLEKAKYAQDFLPQYQGTVESQNQSLRSMIRNALKENLDE